MRGGPVGECAYRDAQIIGKMGNPPKSHPGGLDLQYLTTHGERSTLAARAAVKLSLVSFKQFIQSQLDLHPHPNYSRGACPTSEGTRPAPDQASRPTPPNKLLNIVPSLTPNNPTPIHTHPIPILYPPTQLPPIINTLPQTRAPFLPFSSPPRTTAPSNTLQNPPNIMKPVTAAPSEPETPTDQGRGMDPILPQLPLPSALL